MTTKEASIGIIDDDPVYQFTAKKIVELSHRAGKIHQFTSGDEALTYLSDHREGYLELPDILLLDLNMPVTDGWMFLDAYRKLKPSLCKKMLIYIVTSSIDPRDIAHAKSYPEVIEFISKPLDIDRIQGILTPIE